MSAGLHTNNDPGSGEAMWRKQLAQNGYHYVNVPINTKAGPSIVAVPTTDRVYFIDTAADNVFEMPLSLASSSSESALSLNQDLQKWPNIGPCIQSQSRPSRGAICDSHMLVDSISRCSSQHTTGQTCVNVGSILAHEQQKVRSGPFQTGLSRWTSHNVRQGLRIIPASEVWRLEEPTTPTMYDADMHFNDALYTSLQADIMPEGANPVDDYLNRNPDARMRIYKDEVIGNQGCICECELTNLDQFLTKNKDVNSAIFLRATLSEECKQKLQEPTITRPIKDKLEVLRSQADNILKWVAEYTGGNQCSDGKAQKGPWDASNEDEGMLID